MYKMYNRYGHGFNVCCIANRDCYNNDAISIPEVISPPIAKKSIGAMEEKKVTMPQHHCGALLKEE